MKPIVRFKSIYVKFAVIFLSIWWGFIAMTFAIVHTLLTRSGVNRLSLFQDELFQRFVPMRLAIEATFLFTGLLGTIAIILAVRSIVKPIKRISKMSKEVANGNFEHQVEVEGSDEIAQLGHDFNQMVLGLKSMDELHKNFAANVSHEFKTPITSIQGFAKLIRDGDLPKDQIREYSDIIVEESGRLSHLSSSLLRLSELDSHAIPGEKTTYSLDEQIRKTILILEPLWIHREIAFDLMLDPVRIHGDGQLLQEVWMNLIQNAIKFSGQGDEIRIRLSRSRGEAVVSIRDRGIGIPPADQPHIFERFFKGDRSRSQEGSGLGLVIVRQIVEQAGGTVTFTSQSGQGTEFIVRLPLQDR